LKKKKKSPRTSKNKKAVEDQTKEKEKELGGVL
jgi:hypothetical protein